MQYISASRVELFEYCPRAFYYAYIKKYPGEQSSKLKAGKLFHERIAAAIRQGEPLRVKIPSKWYPVYSSVIDNLGEELWIERKVEGVITSCGKEFSVLGYVDLYDVDNNIIYDWKVSKYPHAKCAQAYLYKELLDQITGERHDVVKFVFLPLQKIITATPQDLKKGEYMVQKFLQNFGEWMFNGGASSDQVGKKVFNGGGWNMSNKCSACGFALYCMANKR